MNHFLVPAVSIKILRLPSETRKWINKVQTLFSSNVQCCMAIALQLVDKDRFQIDFHDVERVILESRPVAKKVIMLMKHLRDVKKGSFNKFWSHFLKTVVLNMIIDSKTKPWYTKKSSFKDLETTLIEALRAWKKEICVNSIYKTHPLFFAFINLVFYLLFLYLIV